MRKNGDRRYENREEIRRKYCGKSMGVSQKETFPKVEYSKNKYAAFRNGWLHGEPVRLIANRVASNGIELGAK